jgi:hypothetical protein
MADVKISIVRYDELLKKEATLETLERYYKSNGYLSAETGLLIIGNKEEEK